VSTRKERRDHAKLHGVCRNCGEKGRHFAPPGFGSPGMYICKPKTEETTSMTDIGKVTHDGATHRAQCLREDCPWTFESTKDGEAGHQLMEHNTDEHTAGSERGVADAGFLLIFLVVLGLVMSITGVVVLVDAVIS